MLRLRRRSPGGASAVDADLSSATIAGPVAIGEHNVQYVAGGDMVVTAAAQRAVPRARAEPARRLPRDFPDLAGRAAELERAAAALAAGGPVELVGADGVGKTALLRHLMHRTSGPPPRDGVVYTAVAKQPVEDVLAELFEAFFAWDEPALPTRGQIAEGLAGISALLVLDDLELDRDAIGRLLDLTPTCTLAFAGKERRLWGEGHAMELAGLSQEAAVAVFERELAGMPDPPPGAAVDALCRALGGHPLLVLQAAALAGSGRVGLPALMAAQGPADVERLRDRSYSEDELRALSPLLALPELALAAEAVAAITGSPGDVATLERLHEERIVRAHSPRYSFAGTPSDEVGRRLDGELWRTRALQQAAYGQSELFADGALVTALLDHGIRARRFEDVLALARRADPLLALAGRWGAWEVTLRHALTAAHDSGNGEAAAWAHHQLGTAALVRGDSADAVVHLRQALKERKRIEDFEGAARTDAHLQRAGAARAPWVVVPGPRSPFIWLLLLATGGAGLVTGLAVGGGGTGKQAAAGGPVRTVTGQGGTVTVVSTQVRTGPGRTVTNTVSGSGATKTVSVTADPTTVTETVTDSVTDTVTETVTSVTTQFVRGQAPPPTQIP